MTPSRAFFTIGERVEMMRGVPSLFGGRSFTPIAQEACGFGGPPTTSIRHMRQLPAIDSRSWKQKRGISAPAASHACNSVYSGGTSISVPSTMSLVIRITGPVVLASHTARSRGHEAKANTQRAIRLTSGIIAKIDHHPDK